MSLTLFEEFAPVLTSLSDAEIDDPQSAQRLKMASEHIGARHVEMIYAPFDHINTSARVVIVGMTPGRFQAANALRAARRALLEGRSVAEAAAAAKTFASFSGEPMRTNLVRMLYLIGVGQWLGLASTASLWSENGDLVHFTSALRYPVFVDGPHVMQGHVQPVQSGHFGGVHRPQTNHADVLRRHRVINCWKPVKPRPSGEIGYGRAVQIAAVGAVGRMKIGVRVQPQHEQRATK